MEGTTRFFLDKVNTSAAFRPNIAHEFCGWAARIASKMASDTDRKIQIAYLTLELWGA